MDKEKGEEVFEAVVEDVKNKSGHSGVYPVSNEMAKELGKPENTYLKYVVSSFHISIEDKNSSSKFSASRTTSGDIHPTIFNNNENESSYIYPKTFLKLSIELFRRMGNPITGIVGEWHDADQTKKNYSEFAKNLKGVDFSEEKILQAAKKTWTGRVAAENGFKNVSLVRPSLEEFKGDNGKIKIHHVVSFRFY